MHMSNSVLKDNLVFDLEEAIKDREKRANEASARKDTAYAFALQLPVAGLKQAIKIIKEYKE